MAVTFLPPDLEQEPFGVTVSVVAGASDIEQVAGSFRGLVDIRSIPDFSSAVGYDVAFRQSENRQEVEILLPLGDDRSSEHRILVSVAVSPFPALDSIAHAVLAPGFAPGGVGIDWGDVCRILRSGKRGVLALAEYGFASNGAVGTRDREDINQPPETLGNPVYLQRSSHNADGYVATPLFRIRG